MKKGAISAPSARLPAGSIAVTGWMLEIFVKPDRVFPPPRGF